MADEQRTSSVEQLQEQVNQRVRQAVDDLQRELRERLRRAGDQIVGELENRLGDEPPSLPESFLSPDELSHLADEAAAAARDQARRESVGSLTPSLAALDRARNQKGVLDTLVTEAARFAGRSAVFLVRGDALELWGAHGWDGDVESARMEGTRIPLADEGPWSSDSLASGAVDVGSTYCGELCSQVDAPLPGAAVLIPLFLRDKLAAVVYADHEESGGLATEALQGLTYVAALALESLPFRKRESTPTLGRAAAAGAGAGAEAVSEEAPAAAGEPAAPEVEEAEEAGEAEWDEPADDTDDTLDEVSSLDDAYGAPSFDEAEVDLGDADLGDADLGDADLGDTDLGDTDLEVDDGLSADLEDDTLGDADFSYDLEDVAEEPDGGPEPDPEPGPELEVDSSLDAGDGAWASAPALETEPEEETGAEVTATDDLRADEGEGDEEPAEEPAAELSSAPTSAETVYAPVPPPPAATPEPEMAEPEPEPEPEPDTAEPETAEPAAEEPAAEQAPSEAAPSGGAQVTPPADAGGQVAPPSDLEGPGRAFAKDEPRTEEDARHDEARRLARLLVSEIRLYNEDEVDEGRRNNDIYQRLKEDIDRSRQMYEERVDAGVRDSSDYFYDELVRNLAGGEEDALGL